MTILHSQTTLTAQEYLDWERQQEMRHEFINGEIYAMTGASRSHNLICSNLVAALHSQLRGKSCEVYVNDMRVKVSITGMYTYPDVVIACDKPAFEDQQIDTLLNPLLIIEVLSHSAEGYDRGAKFLHYRNLPSLQDYLLVSQHEIRIEHYTRQADHCWLLTEYQQSDERIEFDALGCSVLVQDVYERVMELFIEV
ncbi:Uma2 family endonuclease [Chromatium okenii]|uniref:Uma2 family endonuclease n=1 Tax=Chromatium okenii TaxID=61644 RepID=UPI0026EB6EAD|nr:Uma2 family endonuclease [Chromatium okenii]MBV5309202.1 Uma2 family endonuclease [Chromatium okenii]